MINMSGFVKKKLEHGRKITIENAIINCNKCGRPYRRRLSERLLLKWNEFLKVERYVFMK